MLKKFFFALMLVNLLSVPTYALGWEESFEGHPDDEPNSVFTSGYFAVTGKDNGYGYGYTSPKSNGYYRDIVINKPFQQYLAFDYHLSGSSGMSNVVKITLRNSTGVVYLNEAYIFNENTNAKSGRVEIEESAGGGGVNIYYNGVLARTVAYNAPSAVDVAGNITLSLLVYHSTYNSVIFMDNFVSGYSGMIGCDESSSYTAEGQYYKAGFPVLLDSYWFARVYDPNNNLITTQNVSLGVENLIPTSLMTEPGEYTIKLYQHYNVSNNNYFFADRSYTYNGQATGTLSVSSNEIKLGDRIKISTTLSPFKEGYTVKIVSGSDVIKSFDVSTESQNFYYTVPIDLGSNYIFVYLVEPDGDVAGYEPIRLIGRTPAPTLEINKETYFSNDTIRVFYTYMPIGTKLTATYYRNGDSFESVTETLEDVVGYTYFSINNRNADSVFVEAYNPTTKEVYASAMASIVPSSYSYRINGKVYDAASGAVISGATVWSESFSTTTDSTGYYESACSPGLTAITAAAEGYEDLHVSAFVGSKDTVQNFYLVKTYISDSGSSLYGSVTDYYTGSPVSNARVVLKNGTMTYTRYSDSRGYFELDNANLIGLWSVKVSVSGYDVYDTTVNIEGDTYLGIRLVPESGEPEVPPENNADPNVPGQIDNTNYSSLPYGAYGRHAFDFDGDGRVSGEEWRYAVEHLSLALGCLMFLGFLQIVGRAGRR